MKTYVAYHACCVDGFGAAFAASKVLPEDTIYIAMNHYDSLPHFNPGSKIYCLDFCFKKHEILEIIKHSSLTIIDHHLSEAKELESILSLKDDNLEIIFNMNKSGATMTWDYFHSTPPPDFFPYIEDRDLTKYSLPNTKEIISALMLKPKDFKTWDSLSAAALLQEGLLFESFKKQIMEETLERHHFADIGGVLVPAINSTCFWSDITFLLLEKYPQSPFVAAYYSIDGDRIKWSLRSREGSNIDVGDISKAFGGGGHPNSGGFSAPKDLISFKKNLKIAS